MRARVRVEIGTRRRSAEGWWAFAALVILIGVIAQVSEVAAGIILAAVCVVWAAAAIGRTR